MLKFYNKKAKEIKSAVNSLTDNSECISYIHSEDWDSDIEKLFSLVENDIQRKEFEYQFVPSGYPHGAQTLKIIYPENIFVKMEEISKDYIDKLRKIKGL